MSPFSAILCWHPAMVRCAICKGRTPGLKKTLCRDCHFLKDAMLEHGIERTRRALLRAVSTLSETPSAIQRAHAFEQHAVSCFASTPGCLVEYDSFYCCFDRSSLPATTTARQLASLKMQLYWLPRLYLQPKPPLKPLSPLLDVSAP